MILSIVLYFLGIVIGVCIGLKIAEINYFTKWEKQIKSKYER